MVPVPWHDILEGIHRPDKPNGWVELQTSGNAINCPPEKNLVIKAFGSLENFIGKNLPATELYLKKIVPDGAGLGGGSADAAFTLSLLNELYELELPAHTLAEIAGSIGADCPFFIYNRTMLATVTGTNLLPCDNPLWGKKIVIIKHPDTFISTAQAYQQVDVKPAPEQWVRHMLQSHIINWQPIVFNAFQQGAIQMHPLIGKLIDCLKAAGAQYAAMSGSGSAVFGIFESDNLAETKLELPHGCHIFKGVIDAS